MRQIPAVRGGSVLVLMIILVALVSGLALITGSLVVSRSRLATDARLRMELRNAACSAAAMTAWSVDADTNGVDHLRETWARMERLDAVSLRVTDERARLPFPEAGPEALAALLMVTGGGDRVAADGQAIRLHAWWDQARAAAINRVLIAEEELLLAAGSDPVLLAAALPHLTVQGGGNVNINTVGREVWIALAMGAGADAAVAEGLFERLEQSRRRGEWFETLDPREVTARLTGRGPSLSVSELTVLQALASGMCVESGHFRITATAERNHVRRTVQCLYERGTGRIHRWLEF